MRLLKFLARLLFEMAKGVLFRWIVALFAAIGAILATIEDFFRRQGLAHAEKNAVASGCVTVSHPAFLRPDPLIYSQPYLLSLGLAVTWDNPDIAILQSGSPVAENQLLPNTDYEIDATIWNNSFNAPAVGVIAEFSYLSFGIGTASTLIGSRAFDLGVKGGANHPAHVRMPWRTPPVAGHYCIQVKLQWFDDLNPANNLGQNNVDVRPAQSPARFTFAVTNDSNLKRDYVFQFDSYVLPNLDQCGKRIRKPKDKDRRWRSIQAAHARRDFPTPPGWSIQIAPSQVALNPGQTSDIQVTITPPNGWVGRQPINVSALYDEGVYAGGVTLHVTRQ